MEKNSPSLMSPWICAPGLGVGTTKATWQEFKSAEEVRRKGDCKEIRDKNISLYLCAFAVNNTISFPPSKNPQPSTPQDIHYYQVSRSITPRYNHHDLQAR